MNTNSYYVAVYVTTLTGFTYVPDADTLVAVGTLAKAKEVIATAQAQRAAWDNDGFTRKVEYVVRYGSHRNGWDAREYVVTFEFDDVRRKFVNAYEALVAVSN